MKCMNRKLLFIFSCVLVFAMFLTGCGNTQTAEEPSSETTVSSQIDSSETIMTSQPNSLDEAVSSEELTESLTGETQIEKEEGDTVEENESVNSSSVQTSQQPEENTSLQSEETEAESTVSAQTEQFPEENLQQQNSEPPSNSQTLSEQDAGNTTSEEEITTVKMNVQIGGSTFTATLEENAAVDALVEMMEQGPVTIQMSDYSGFEKVGSLGTNLPTSNSQTTTHAGDIALYQGNQIVIFYGSNSWSYTRLGQIDDLTGWEEALGSGDVTVTFSLQE